MVYVLLPLMQSRMQHKLVRRFIGHVYQADIIRLQQNDWLTGSLMGWSCRVGRNLALASSCIWFCIGSTDCGLIASVDKVL